MPLLKMDAATLGSDMTELEQNLASSFQLAERWHAISLLDEADVFLERRSPSDLKRNRLVAGKALRYFHWAAMAQLIVHGLAFLRAIEYFGGILFLTTNRVKSFDRAFKSRIHLALYYPDLNPESRIKIWRVLLSRPGVDTDPELWHGNLLEQVAVENLNGREIKNAVHMAHALAISQQCPINKSHLDSALNARRAFDADWEVGMWERDEEEPNDNLGRAAKRKRVATDT